MSKFTEIILRCYKYLDKVPLPKLDCHTSVNIANYNKTTSIFLNWYVEKLAVGLSKLCQ
jgi:hypothetical protein